MAQRVKIRPTADWKRRLKRSSSSFGSVATILVGTIEAVNAGLLSLPQYVVERIPYGSSLIIGSWGLLILFRLFEFVKDDADGNESDQ